MANKRLYDLAKEYNVSSKAMVDIVKELGFDVKSHSSAASDEVIAAVQKRFASEKEEVKKEIEEKKRKGKPKLDISPTRKRFAKDRKLNEKCSRNCARQRKKR